MQQSPSPRPPRSTAKRAPKLDAKPHDPAAERCKRCGKTDHASRKCKAPFAKSWPGRPAMKILLRFPDGMTMEMTAALTQDQFERVESVCREAWGLPETAAAEPTTVPS